MTDIKLLIFANDDEFSTTSTIHHMRLKMHNVEFDFAVVSTTLFTFVLSLIDDVIVISISVSDRIINCSQSK